MTKSLFLVTGNKGGCGKTPISTYLIDYLIRKDVDKRNILIVDCESAESQATLTRILSQSYKQDKVYNINLSYEQGYEELISLVMENDCEYCIVDTGAGLLGELKRNLDLLSPLSEYNIFIHIVFVVGPTPESTAAARSFLYENKKFHITTTFVLLAPPVENILKLKDTDFDFKKAEDIKDLIDKPFYNVLFIPTIRQDLFDKTHIEGHLPNIILKSDKLLSIPTKIRFSNFIKNYIDPVMNEIIENHHSENSSDNENVSGKEDE